MDNQTRNHLNLQKHIADQDHIIRVRNAEIAALRKRAEKAEKDLTQAADTPRPLTPDAITDEMVERALVVNADLRPETVRRMLTAALTEPPARPEGADRWEDFLIDSLDYQALTDQQITDLADRIAEEMNR